MQLAQVHLTQCLKALFSVLYTYFDSRKDPVSFYFLVRSHHLGCIICYKPQSTEQRKQVRPFELSRRTSASIQFLRLKLVEAFPNCVVYKLPDIYPHLTLLSRSELFQFPR